MPDAVWEKVEDYDLLRVAWEDCTMGFRCPGCGATVMVDPQNGPSECCGKRWRLVTCIEVADA